MHPIPPPFTCDLKKQIQFRLRVHSTAGLEASYV
jgi:hypothetical protein